MTNSNIASNGLTTHLDTPTNHVVIWIDHREAHILYFDPIKNELIKSNSKQPHLHHKANEIGSGNAIQDHAYYQQVIHSVSDVYEILIIGPGDAKDELRKYAIQHQPLIAKNIVGLETVDHPTDRQVLAFAKKFFKRIDRLKGH